MSGYLTPDDLRDLDVLALANLIESRREERDRRARKLRRADDALSEALQEQARRAVERNRERLAAGCQGCPLDRGESPTTPEEGKQ